MLAALSGRLLVAHVARVEEEQCLDGAFRGHGVRLRGEAIDTGRLAEGRGSAHGGE